MRAAEWLLLAFFAISANAVRFDIHMHLFCSRNTTHGRHLPPLPFDGYAELMEEDFWVDDQVSERKTFVVEAGDCVDFRLLGEVLRDRGNWVEPYVWIVHNCHGRAKSTKIYLREQHIADPDQNIVIAYDLATDQKGLRLRHDCTGVRTVCKLSGCHHVDRDSVDD